MPLTYVGFQTEARFIRVQFLVPILNSTLQLVYKYLESVHGQVQWFLSKNLILAHFLTPLID